MAIDRPSSAPSLPAGADEHQEALGQTALRKVTLRLIPVLGIGYGLAYMDRISVSFAALRMNQDLHFSATVYGLGAGLFFIGNAMAEVPSNLLLLRFGAKRIMATIVFFWGLAATAMMFVRTPWEFYLLRTLLGVAEAGFYPGVIYYLTLWYPAKRRARAVSTFYIALPLSSVVMGSLAGWLMGLEGTWGLSGWQWLFLVEGLPAILYAPVILKLLPDHPSHVSWLTDEEKSWLKRQLALDGSRAHLGHEAGILAALLSPKVWSIGLFFFFIGFCGYGFSFSAPAIFQGATGWNVSQIGWMIALFSLIGAVAMLLNGIHSDRKGERALHCIVPCAILALGYIVGSTATLPWLVVLALAASYIAHFSLWGPALSIPMEFLAGKAAAAGIAAMNSIAIFSGFFGPYWIGWMKDKTGSYNAGVQGLLVSAIAAAVIMHFLTRSLKRGEAARSEQ